MSLKSLLDSGAIEIAQHIKNKDVSPLEVVRLHIDHIEYINPKINAIVERLYEQALALAEKQTEQLTKSKENLPVLFGVPFTIKEMMAHKGSYRTGGSFHRKDLRADFDGTIVGRMKAAGAIPLAMTNVPELGFWFECYNSIYGKTNNPYDYSRTPGGSSGGEAAIIGAGGSPFGLGSDIGGSIRIPSSFCGIYGHKPTNKIIPITGHFPYSIDEIKKLKGDQYPYTTHGPMARKASDLYPLMQLMIGPDGIDPETMSNFKLKERPTDFSKVKIYYIQNPEIYLASSVDKEISDTVLKVVDYFKSMGCQTEALDSDLFSKAAMFWSSALKNKKSNTFEYNLTSGNGLFLLKEMIAMSLNKSKYTFPGLATAFVERLTSNSKNDHIHVLKLVGRKIQDMNSLLKENAVLIMPSFPTVAPKHYRAILGPFDFMYTAIFNALQMPATSAHVTLNKDSLPIGVQVVSAQFNDYLTITAAEEIEKGFGGWKPPKPLNI